MAVADVKAPALEATTLDVAGTPVAVRRKGTGRPLLFLHGAGFTGQWLRFHEALAQGADVIAPEHVGFGGTPLQDWLDGFDDLVLHYDDLRATLGLDEPFDLVGYSLGGWIAAAYATFYPEKLRSLTLITPAGFPLEGDSVRRPLPHVPRGALRDDLQRHGQHRRGRRPIRRTSTPP